MKWRIDPFMRSAWLVQIRSRSAQGTRQVLCQDRAATLTSPPPAGGGGSFGQSFKPTLSSIKWAEFALADVSSSSGGVGPVDLSLSILDGLIGFDGLGG